MDRTTHPCAKRMRGGRGERSLGGVCNLHHGCLTGIMTTYKNEDFSGPYSWWECWVNPLQMYLIATLHRWKWCSLNPLSSESSCLVSLDSQPFPDCSRPPATVCAPVRFMVLFSMVPTCSACLISSFSAVSTLRLSQAASLPIVCHVCQAACSMSVTGWLLVCSKTSSLWNPNSFPNTVTLGMGKVSRVSCACS